MVVGLSLYTPLLANCSIPRESELVQVSYSFSCQDVARQRNIFLNNSWSRKSVPLRPGLNNYTKPLTGDHYKDAFVMMPEQPQLPWLYHYSPKLLPQGKEMHIYLHIKKKNNCLSFILCRRKTSFSNCTGWWSGQLEHHINLSVKFPWLFFHLND